MKNCFEGYLTDACKTCEYWRNDETSIGCCTPYPIDHCEAFSEMYNKEENENDI